ncbi:MAG: enoyl-CoA hydratase [Gammaproteobacteria bacterium]|nr:enoyl-CoA hydratase [Gammaproteobacteria bacterium]NIM74005.1 enoyl-CoA hydratase [Gammaproteobacteria bacterium]NIN38886.1 enoyl-CoA hydratase [Gammaproteobacteria bacterium]NIO25781.1 enoyl-CoA hydratase [Gammaproteobacteria bacterium]NIO66411.1 enoyl-CoA hydratase [Gammaproteobacteria bacterium]
MDLATEKILAEVREGVGWLTINNPERRNAISLDMWDAMRQAVEAFGADPVVRCVVLRGAGEKAFASGADISQFEKERADAEAAMRYATISRAGRDALLGLEKPLLAMIRGFCMGGGLGIAMTADLRIASADAVLGIPAARLGIAYDAQNVANLVSLVGPSRAKDILITGRRLGAEEALAMGLVNRVVSVAELENTCTEITAQIVDNAPLSMRASKLTVKEILRGEGARDDALIVDLGRECFDSEDYQEGRRAFMEKRRPQFNGR